MFRYLFERLCALSQDILDLLEQVDAFPFNQLGYSLGQSPYQSLGDLHDSLENVYVRSDAGTRTHTVRMTIRKVRELFEEWTREVERMRAHNDRIYQQMGQCQSQEEWERLRAKLIPDDEWPQPKILERVLDEHANEPDNTEVDVETTHYLDGYYSRNTNHPVQGVVVLRYDTRIYPLVCTYIHEMMHAFYDADLRNPMNDAEYAEEPLAEYGMLHFVESFVRSHPKHADMLTYAKECVRKKQSNFGIAHYGFGAYLYEHFQHIEWEHLMRDAHSRINNTIAPYTDLKDALNGVYPSATQLPRVAQLLHDVLTDANGQARSIIHSSSGRLSTTLTTTVNSADGMPHISSPSSMVFPPVVPTTNELLTFQLKYLAWMLSRQCSTSDDERMTNILAEAQVDMNPHQVDAALFAFNSPFSRGVVLADEVGLGKTIEAGLVISEHWAEKKRRILIISPASLRKQWSIEMMEKFYLPSEIIEKKSNIEYAHLRDGKQLFICSYEFASRQHIALGAIDWDLVVFDEAHRMRNVWKSSSIMPNLMADTFRGKRKLLLTATPLQNNLNELYGLVSIIKPDHFGDPSAFRAATSGIDSRDASVRQKAFNDLRNRLLPIVHRTLRRQVTEYVNYTRRIAMSQQYTPSQDELDLYTMLNDYLSWDEAWGLPESQRQLITMIFRKLMASSSFAIADTLCKIINRLRTMANMQLIAGGSEDLVDVIGDVEEDWDLSPLTLATGFTADQLASIIKEIEYLEKARKLALDIKANSKGYCLLKALPDAFSKLEELGASRKALIFTESKRTQDYLYELLSLNGYNGKIVLFNGSNSDSRQKTIYDNWIALNAGSSVVTKSRTANMRQALVDYFKTDAEIMIATEAAAEGINLQFCSLVVNYDLPWNPQRVEQRIGRCHRYGQKHDVVVVNFINTSNAADQRVYELLDQKFKLFDGIFGSSDEVLGAVESGVDFEKRLLDILNTCRTEAEINQAFDNLQAEMDAEISERLKKTHQSLLENFDETVLDMLKMRMERTSEGMSRYEHCLWLLLLGVLDGHIDISDVNSLLFQLLDNPYSSICPNIELNQYHVGKHTDKGEMIRIQSDLCQHVIQDAKNYPVEYDQVEFDYNKYGLKISAIESLPIKEGYLMGRIVTFESEGDTEEQIVLAIVDKDGQMVDTETAHRMMMLPCKSIGKYSIPTDIQTLLSQQYDKEKQLVADMISHRNSDLLAKELLQIEAWAESAEASIGQQISNLTKQKKELKRAIPMATSPAERIEIETNLNKIEIDLRKARRTQDEQIDKILERRQQMIEELKKILNQHVSDADMFRIHWTIKM